MAVMTVFFRHVSFLSQDFSLFQTQITLFYTVKRLYSLATGG
ncbi:hypothetical protein Dde_4039 [Oleidesulfovibrio alaskensis G20]|jgi:hypothetical protein|uniref:Uncharacterized protein n=1 Tax=Oleidesulfovibrio alaskensis (strain ATCC BAA-1058 / DSM 17464 / G20) TaxID=207559 RepID=F9XXI1_OLEA2|nr:hypothetical protein Dde_4039 [Oleidesulfovibrio alaskensis G20]